MQPKLGNGSSSMPQPAVLGLSYVSSSALGVFTSSAQPAPHKRLKLPSQMVLRRSSSLLKRILLREYSNSRVEKVFMASTTESARIRASYPFQNEGSTHSHKLLNSWELNFEVIRRKGTIVSIGNASGAVPPFPPLKLAPKNLKFVRPVYVDHHPTDL